MLISELSSEEISEHNERTLAAYPLQVNALSEEVGGGFEAFYVPLMRNVVGYGHTVHETLDELSLASTAYLTDLASKGQTLHEHVVSREWDDYSGKFNVRVTRSLHALLAALAEEQGVSLNSLIQTILSSGATALASGSMFGALRMSTESSVVSAA